MTVKQIHIEKYDFDGFEKEGKPYVMIRTEIIQKMAMTHANEFLLWCFLESLPPTWKPNKSHLTQHFKISDRTYERYMAFLNGVGLIEYRQNRGQGGSFGKGTLIVLDGAKFNMDAITNGTVKIGGTVMNKKKAKVIHISDANRTAKIGDTAKHSTTRSSTDESKNSPNRQITEVRLDDAHINTTKRSTKEKKKTNKESVSVFSDTDSIKTHITLVLAKRKAFVEDEVIEQIVFYIGKDRDYEVVVKKINIALKKVRDGKWNIPQGYKGITSQSIREKEEKERIEKQNQYKKEAQVFQEIAGSVVKGEGLKGFSAMFKKLKDDLNDNKQRKSANIG
jgi:hypothetical protein